VIRSIYAKILLWFWVVAIAAAAVVVLFANLSGSQPRAYLRMSLASGTYAQGAVDLTCKAASRPWPSCSHGIRATLLDPHDQDILGTGVPPESADLLRQARETGQSRFRGGIV
jgi:hypothetical protein